MIVDWHEVPATAPPQKNRPVGYGMIRADARTIRRLEGGNFNAVSLNRNRNDP